MMITKAKQGLLMLFFLSMLAACSTRNIDNEIAAPDIERIKQEIQEKENEFAAVYNSQEMKQIGYYAEDAITFSQNSPPIVGKPAILEYLIANLDSLSVGNKISFKTNEVFVSNDGNQVVEIGYYKVVDIDSNVVNSGNYMTLFVKRDGQYVCLRDMSASDMPIR